MSADYYYRQGSQTLGPVPFEQLKQLIASGHLGPTDHVCPVGSQQWLFASGVPELYPNGPPPAAVPGASFDAIRKSKGWKLAPPSSLCLALLLLPLPWLELRCESEGLRMTLATQSGVQTMNGGYTLSDRGKQANKENAAGFMDKMRPSPSILMTLFLISLLAGIGTGFYIQARGPWPPSCLWIIAALPCALFLLQMIVGFPLQHELKKNIDEREQSLKSNPDRSVKDVQLEATTKALVEGFGVHYSSWLWLAFLATLTPPIIYGLEHFLQTQAARSKGGGVAVPG